MSIVLSTLLAAVLADTPGLSAHVTTFYGYKDCIRLQNSHTRVTLCPAAGGRVLEYWWKGKNALYLPAGDEGWTWKPGGKRGAMNAGRFDIGPEQVVPKRPTLWMGRWTGKITGPRSARLTSAKDKSTGVQLVRDFTLAKTGSKLECKQTIVNVSMKTVEYCHWSRTFALGGGICVIPLAGKSRLPNGYVMYHPKSLINFRPRDPAIKNKDKFLVITGPPKYPKLGMDTQAGWFGYLMKHDVMFVKKFPVYPNRVYNEVAGLTMSIWYPADRPCCELEPIGPREKLAPGKSASFTETWYLLPYKFPKDGKSVDTQAIDKLVKSRTKSK